MAQNVYNYIIKRLSYWCRWILSLVEISADARKLSSFDIPTRGNIHRYQCNNPIFLYQIDFYISATYNSWCTSCYICFWCPELELGCVHICSYVSSRYPEFQWDVIVIHFLNISSRSCGWVLGSVLFAWLLKLLVNTQISQPRHVKRHIRLMLFVIFQIFMCSP